MPKVAFQELPDDARAWVFASQRELSSDESERVLAAVDEHLEVWAAHGTPLYSAREWRDGRFLIVAVDERAAGASGCSIDGLFRVLRGLESELGTRLTAGGLVYYRARPDNVRAASRDEFRQDSADGSISRNTPVFDTAITSLGAYRSRFEIAAEDSWHATLLAKGGGEKEGSGAAGPASREPPG